MDLYQQPHRYMRPPPPLLPPSMADPYHNQQLGQRPSGPPPQGPWFSNQFQYHHPSHSPSPPPPPPSPWGPPPPPPPPPASAGSYPPPPHPYPAQYIQHNQFPPLPPQPPPPHRPHMAPHFPPHSQIPQPYSQVKQDWGNQNWAPPPQSWDYSGQNNEEDWAARARAWADAKAAMENQNSQSHYAPEQYQQAKSSHYSDAAHQSLPPSSYEQFPVAASPLNQLPGSHQQESASIGTEPPSFVPDELQHYPARDGGLGKDANAGFHHQGNLPSSSSVNQQEVPSSYSSVTGKEVMADQNEHSYRLFPARNSSSQEGQQHLQPSFPPSYAYGNQSVDPMHNPADQPLEFAPRFGHDHDLQMHSNYAHHDSVGPGRGMDSINTWTPPAVPGMVYPPMPSGFPSAPQHAPSIALPSVSGHNPPPFGSFPGQGLPSAIPSGATPFPLTAGTALPTTAFPGDTYGISNMIERPKKAPVPNWLREEIKKAVITGSSVDHPKEETQFIEDEGLDNSFTKGDQADSKSVDSPRSTEEEDDEDEVEAAKTAAINLEIKRVLTEVLLKVTDELFDEIATKVLDEDDSSAPATRKIVTSNQKEATFALSAPTPKASAKVLIPVKPKEQELDTDGSNKSSSNSAGNVLGLANYDSDEDDGKGNGEIQSLKMSDSSKNDHLQHSSTIKLAEKMHVAVGIGSSQVDLQEHGDLPTNINNSVKTSLNEFRNTNSTAISKVNGDMVDEEKEHTSNSDTNGRDNEIKVSGTISRSKEASGSTEFKTPKETLNEKESSKSHRGKETKVKLDKDDRHESWTSSSVKDDLKDVKETAKTKKDEIGDENRRRQDERHLRKEKNSDGQKLSKERKKDDEIKHGERANESGSKKRSTHSETRDDRKETDGSQRSSAKDITDIRREQTKGKEEERSSRQKCSGDSRRHKSKRSPSNSTRGRGSKENSASHANSSSDSDDSRRKPRSRKRNSSPSPVRSKRRQVSRSPHSKHSQRRHSPYSSLDSTRGRRSRSRSPVRRKR